MDLLAPQESLAERELELETQRIPRDRLVAREKAQALRDKVGAVEYILVVQLHQAGAALTTCRAITSAPVLSLFLSVSRSI